MLKTLFCAVAMLGLAMSAEAQGIKPPELGAGVIYNYETNFNLKVTSNRGYAPGMEWGRLRTYYRTTYYFVNLGELKHTKEQRQSADPSISRSFRPYVFGKQNTFFVVRGGWGAKRYYTEKARQKGVAMGMSYSFGPTLGLLKPYYLALRRPSPDNPGNSRVRHEKYTEENASVFLDNTRILGASPFTRGFSEVGFLPGANGSIAFHMDWGAFDKMVKAFEIGIMLDVFPKAAPIMIYEDNSPFFLNFFINAQFGKRR